MLDDFEPRDPYLVVVKQPNSILFKPLGGGPLATLNVTIPETFASHVSNPPVRVLVCRLIAH